MKLLQGNPSDILRDYAQDKYFCFEINGRYLFSDNTESEEGVYELPEEVENYLDIILYTT